MKADRFILNACLRILETTKSRWPSLFVRSVAVSCNRPRLPTNASSTSATEAFDHHAGVSPICFIAGG